MVNFLTRIKENFLPKYGQLIGLGLLIVFVLAGNIAWIRENTSPIPEVDSNHYMFNTLSFVDKLGSQGLNQIWSSIADMSVEGRPPLYQLLSVPFVLLFGRSMDSGLYVNLAFEILLLISVYNIGKLVENGKAGLLAAIVVAAYPPLISLSRFYRPHFALAACVALTVWLLLLLQKKPSIKTIWLFGGSLAFGLLIHPTFLWAVPVPAVVFCLYIVFSRPHSIQMSIKQAPAWFCLKIRDPLVLYGLLPVFAISIGLVLGWYLTLGQPLLSTLTRMTSSEVAEFRGEEIITVGFGNVRPSFWWYAVTAPNALSTVFVVLLAIGMVASLIKRQFPDLMLLALFVVGYTVLSLQGTLGWRYFAPILPIAAALTGVWIGRIPNRIASSILIFLCIVTAIFNFSIVTWGIQPWNRQVAFVLGAPEDPESVRCAFEAGWGFCPAPPRSENWPVEDILSVVLNDPACMSDVCDLLVANQTRYLNSSIFEYYSKLNFPGIPLSSLSLGYLRGGIPMNLPAILNSEYIVYENVRTGWAQTFSASAIRLLQSPPPAFASAHEEVAEFMLPNVNKVKMIKRIMPLTVNEAEATIAAIDLPDKFKIRQYEVLAPLYAEEGDLIKSLSYYEQALKHTQDPQTRVEYLKEMGRIYLSLGRTEEAIVAFQDILKINQNDFDAHTSLAKTFQDRNDCEAAIPHWLGRLKTQTSSNVYSDLGDAYLKCEDLDNAVGAYQDALKLEPRDPRARLGLAMSYASQGQTDAAIQEFQKVIQYAPESEFAQQAQEWLDNHK